jgi:electron transfer flavoprotein alpha subunit
MSSILFAAHTEPDGTLGKAALEALTAAVQLKDALGADLAIGLVGQDAQDAANQVAGCGAGRFLAVTGEPFSHGRYATDAAALEALAKAAGADYVVAPGTARTNRVFPGALHRLGGKGDLHVSQLEGANGHVTATRWYYRQRMFATYQRSSTPWGFSIDPGIHPSWQGEAGSAEVEAVDPGAVHAKTQVTGVRAPAADEQTIRPEAKLLFVAGAGWTKKQSDGQPHVDKAADLILDFLGKSQASLGGSKSMVDLASEGQATLPFMTHLNQVGQTGATPRHPKGLATCCHGEEPHVVGWRFVNERRAINVDANCGWAQGKADVVYIADAFAVMEKLNELLA